MEKLKIEKKKHDHKLTDLLKVAIFSLIMLAPMFAIASKCIYVAYNKNAYQSYSGTTYIEMQPIYYETNEVNSNADIIVGNIYEWIDNITLPQDSIRNNLFNLSYNSYDNDCNSIYKDANESIYLTNLTNKYYNLTINTDIRFYFVPSRVYQPYSNLYQAVSKCEIKIIKEYEQVTQTETLDNVFYLAVNSIKNQTLFNWTTETAIYSAINGMCSGLAVENGVLPILLTYWSLMTAIYIVFDLIIFTFTKITHYINSD